MDLQSLEIKKTPRQNLYYITKNCQQNAQKKDADTNHKIKLNFHGYCGEGTTNYNLTKTKVSFEHKRI